MTLARHRVSRHQLDNGLQVVLHEDSSLPLVAINLWYHVGSKDEQPGLTGLAHLFEHMLFQGSANVGDNEHFGYVQQVGGVANGSTWYDRTNYYETLPAHHLELGLWLESDRMGFLLPALTQEKLDNQRSVVMNERRQRVDNQPYGRASERIHELLYPSDHPYHWPVIGYMADIEAATLGDVTSFFETYYTPSNAVLSLAGDFASEAALNLVERYFGSLPAGPGLERKPPDAPLAHAGRESETQEDAVSLARVYLAYCVPKCGEHEWYAASLLATILGDGKASRLFRRLVHDRQIAQDAGAYLLPTESCATFGMVATARPEEQVEPLETALLAELEQVVEHGIEETERERALNTLLTAQYDELQSLDSRADALSMATTYFDDPELVWSEHERYQAITVDDVRDLAANYCRSSMVASVSVVPAP